MTKFFPENYRTAMRDISQLFIMLERVQMHKESCTDHNLGRPTADALLLAAVEIWKHQNPWIGQEYGEEPF